MKKSQLSKVQIIKVIALQEKVDEQYLISVANSTSAMGLFTIGRVNIIDK